MCQPASDGGGGGLMGRPLELSSFFAFRGGPNWLQPVPPAFFPSHAFHIIQCSPEKSLQEPVPKAPLFPVALFLLFVPSLGGRVGGGDVL